MAHVCPMGSLDVWKSRFMISGDQCVEIMLLTKKQMSSVEWLDIRTYNDQCLLNISHHIYVLFVNWSSD